MARATTCFFEDKEITIEDAIEIREKTGFRDKKSLNFTCTVCGEKVRPHRDGGHTSVCFR